MNENLIEVFSRNRRANAQNKSQAEASLLPPKLNPNVCKYYDQAQKPSGAGPWLDCTEMPTSAEIMDMDGDSANSDIVEIAPNKIDGPWESKGESLPVTPQFATNANLAIQRRTCLLTMSYSVRMRYVHCEMQYASSGKIPS